MNEYTPGPWEVHHGSSVRSIDGLPICSTMQGLNQGPARVEANAHLIAAAPELLAACEQAEDTFKICEPEPIIAFAVIENLRAAINKAHGG